MLKITCFNCKQSWTLNSESVQAAYDSLEEGQTHYTIECPKCRKTNKVAIKQLRRNLPRAKKNP